MDHEDLLFGMAKVALCLYCHEIIFSDATPGEAEDSTASNLGNEQSAIWARNEFENRLMQRLVKTEDIQGLPKRVRRKACAVHVTIKLDKPDRINEDALRRMISV